MATETGLLNAAGRGDLDKLLFCLDNHVNIECRGITYSFITEIIVKF